MKDVPNFVPDLANPCWWEYVNSTFNPYENNTFYNYKGNLFTATHERKQIQDLSRRWKELKKIVDSSRGKYDFLNKRLRCLPGK